MAALAAGLVATAAPFAVPSAGAAGQTTLTFLNFNDFHGRIDANTTRFATTIETERAAAPGGADSVLLLSAGDNVGASLFASRIADDQPTIDVLNALDLDASAVGNHEFDQGAADLFDDIIGTGPNAAWPYLAANVYAAGTTTVPSPLEEYTVITLNAGQIDEVRVGIIGAVTQETPSLVSPSGVSSLTFGDPVDAVNRVATQLSDGDATNGEADVIVAEYHEGAPESSTAGDPTLAAEMAASPVFAKIAEQTSANVDVIFTGHTHKTYVFDGPVPGVTGRTRPIVQTGNYGENVGRVQLTVDDDTAGDPVVSYTAVNVPRSTTEDLGLPRVAAVKTIVDTALTDAATLGSVPVGSVTADITTAFAGGTYTGSGVTYTGGARDDRARESALGGLIADSIVASLADPTRGGAEIGVINPGGIRADLLYNADGVITYAEADSVLPFANTLVTVTLTGEQFKTLLEQQWQRDATGNVPSRAYLQLGVSSNVTYTYDPALPEGSRITSITVDGEPIDPNGEYRVGANSFLADGGDNFRLFNDATDVRDSGLIDSEAFIQYLQDNPGLAPDFARQGVQVTGVTDVLHTGTNLTLTVGEDRTTTPQPIGGSSLDLTSLGAPANTSLAVTLGGVALGMVPVTNGTATVDLALPATVPSGAQDLLLTAEPSGTTVVVRVTVDPALTAIQPTRLFDTRPGESPEAVRTVPKSKVGGATELTVRAVDIPGKVPATGVGALSLNVAVTNPEADGFVTVYDCTNRQLVASVNYVAGETVSNAVIAPVSSTGNICFYSLALTDIVVDVNGWLAQGSDYTAVSPYRLFDTRPGESPNALVTVPRGKVGGAGQLLIDVTPTATTGTPSTVIVPPAGVGAVSLNVAVAEPDAAGFVTVYDCGTRQLVASLNYVAGEVASNAVIAPVSPGGNVCFYSLSRTHIIVDINGWFASGGSYVAAGPNRVFDTRGAAESPDALLTVPTAKAGPANILAVDVRSLGEDVTPGSNLGAISINIAATGSTAPGFVTAYACDEPRPFAANLNYLAGQTISNAAIAPVGDDGMVCFYASSDVDLVVDINGYHLG